VDVAIAAVALALLVRLHAPPVLVVFLCAVSAQAVALAGG
jgi:hypothetical protein